MRDAVLRVCGPTSECIAIELESGTVALRGHDTDDPETDSVHSKLYGDLVNLYMDYTTKFVHSMNVLVLVISSRFGVALQRVIEPREGCPIHRRIGLTEFTNYDYHWEQLKEKQIQVEELSIV